MNIFDPHISGSLSVSGSAEISGDLTVLGVVTATISGTTTNALTASFAPNYTLTSSFGDFTSSINTTIKNKLNTEGVISGSSQIVISDTTGFAAFSSSISSSVTTIIVDNFGQDNRLNAIETSTGSLNSFTSSINTTIKNKLNTEGVISGSIQVNLTDTTGYSTFSSSVSSSVGVLSSSVAVTDLNQNNRLNSLEGKSGSYATTGSNTFVGSQVISGSVTITQNLTVFGSSSIVYVTSSQLRVDDNIITLNTSTPGQRFGGIEVYDSGSVTQATGSILWDSVNNRWIYQQSSEAGYGGGMFLSGPRSSGSLGDELSLTSGKIARSAGGDHLNDSIITEYGATTIGINGGLIVTGSILSTVTPLVSGSSQIDLTATTNYSSGIKTRLNAEGVISGSSQILLGTTIHSGSFFNGISVVSGSSQITLSATTGFGSYLNQAVLTSSSPTFSTVSATTFTGALSGNASTATNSTQWNGAIFNGQTTRFNGDVNTLGLSGTSGVYNLGGTLTNSPTTYGTLYAFWNSDISTQFYTSYGGDAYWRKSIGSTYSGAAWRTFLDTSNYNSYSPTLTGTGASGTWGINVTGTAASETLSTVTGRGATTTTLSTFSSGAVIGNMNISKSPYTDTIENKTSGGVVWLNYGHNGNVGLAYGGGNVGVGIVSSPGYLLEIYRNSDVWHTVIGGASGQLRFGAQTSSGAVIQSYTPAGVVRDLYIQRDGGNVGINTTSLSSKFTVYKGSQSNTVSIASSAAYIYGADIGLAIGQDLGAAGYGTWLQSMQTSGTSFPMTINPNGGNVIVGSLTTSSYKFSVYGGQYGTYLKGGDTGTGSDILRLVDANNATKYLARGDGKHFFTGDTTVDGTFTETSSLRYKKDILTIEGGLEMVLKMRGVTYLKKENDIKEVGVIAEEIGEILPDLVKYNTEGQIDSVSYSRITAVLIEAIKELKQEINELKNNG